MWAGREVRERQVGGRHLCKPLPLVERLTCERVCLAEGVDGRGCHWK